MPRTADIISTKVSIESKRNGNFCELARHIAAAVEFQSNLRGMETAITSRRAKRAFLVSIESKRNGNLVAPLVPPVFEGSFNRI